MHAPNDHALLIGVEDYSIYDHSMDLPAGTSAVPGARNDAATFFRQCLLMGFSPSRIRVLTSPRLSPQDLGPEATEVNVGEATHDVVVDGLERLFAAISGPRPAAGLLTFSGHGVQDGGLLLCPSDTTGSLEQAISVSAVAARIGGRAAARRLTALLDCCHAAVIDNEAGLAARLLHRGAGEGVESGLDERVIAACRRGQTAVSSHFGGACMGAFTWAITSAMGQWKVVEEDGVARLTVSHAELTTVTHALLGALAFKQVPVLSGPPGVALLPFLHPGTERHEGEIQVRPDATRDHRQLDGGWYHITVLGVGELAQVFATAGYGISIDNQPATANTEYWYVNEDILGRLLSSTQLSFTYTPFTGSSYHSPSYAHKQSFTLAENVAWTLDGPPISTGAGETSFAYANSATSPTIWLQLLRTSANTLSHIGWYNHVAGNIAPQGAYLPAALPRSSYYAVTQTVP